MKINYKGGWEKLELHYGIPYAKKFWGWQGNKVIDENWIPFLLAVLSKTELNDFSIAHILSFLLPECSKKIKQVINTQF